jgi:hypothetical protein
MRNQAKTKTMTFRWFMLIGDVKFYERRDNNLEAGTRRIIGFLRHRSKLCSFPDDTDGLRTAVSPGRSGNQSLPWAASGTRLLIPFWRLLASCTVRQSIPMPPNQGTQFGLVSIGRPWIELCIKFAELGNCFSVGLTTEQMKTRCTVPP